MFFIKIIVPILFFTLSVAQAADPKKPVPVKGAGGHGGETVQNNGKTTLRDLVEKTNCEWFTLAQVGQSVGYEFKRIMETLGNVNWHLKSAFEREAEVVKVCQTEAPLIQVLTEDGDGLTIVVSGSGKKQMAIRVENRVYLDMNEFRKLSQSDRAYTLIHEETHSFINPKEEMRNTKLRSFVAFLKKYVENPTSKDHFAMQMQQNGIQLSSQFDKLDQMRPDIELALDTNAKLRLRILSAFKVNGYDFYGPDKLTLSYLTKVAADNELKKAIQDNDWAFVYTLVSHGVGYLMTFNPTLFLPTDNECNGNLPGNPAITVCGTGRVIIRNSLGQIVGVIHQKNILRDTTYNLLFMAVLRNDEALVDAVISNYEVFTFAIKNHSMNTYLDISSLPNGCSRYFSALALANYLQETAIYNKILKAMIDNNLERFINENTGCMK